MSTILNRYNFFLNSTNATEKVNGTAACVFDLTQKISLSDPHAFFEVTINRANVAFSFFQFSSERNNNFLSYDIVSPSSSGNITIGSGNYVITQMIEELKILIQQQILNQTGVVVLVTFEYNSIINRVRVKMISTTGNVIINFVSTKLSQALGFSSNWSLNTFTGDWVYGDKDVNMNPICCLYVVSNELTQNSTYDALGTSLQSANIIGVIPLVHGPLYYTIHDPSSTITLRILNHTISRIDLNIITMAGDALTNFFVPYTVEVTINEILLKESANTPLGPPHPTVVGPDFEKLEEEAESLRQRGFKSEADSLLSEGGYNFAAGEELDNFKREQLLELEEIKQNLKRKRV
jgi:hypothetical protein